MIHVDALSRLFTETLVIEDNSLELNLALAQSRDDKLKELKKELQKADDAYFEMRNGIIFRKHNNNLLFYVPQAMESHILFKYHDQLGYLGIEKTMYTIIESYWFPNMKQKVQEYILNCLKCIFFPLSRVRRKDI